MSDVVVRDDIDFEAVLIAFRTGRDAAWRLLRGSEPSRDMALVFAGVLAAAFEQLDELITTTSEEDEED